MVLICLKSHCGVRGRYAQIGQNSGQAEMSVHGFYEKVLNLRYEDRRCNMDVPPGGDGRTV